MLHAHVTPKSITIICEYSKISGVYTQKKGHLLFKLNSKDQSVKINYCVNYIQLNRLVSKQDVFKKKSVRFDKRSLNTGIINYFLNLTNKFSFTDFDKRSLNTGIINYFLNLTNKFSFTDKVKSALCLGAFNMALLEITHFISTPGFFGGKANFITSKYQQYLVSGSFQFIFWILVP